MDFAASLIGRMVSDDKRVLRTNLSLAVWMVVDTEAMEVDILW